MSNKIIWITGRSGSGKTTLATGLSRALYKKEHVIILDGDEIREIIENRDYSPKGRALHLRYMTLMADVLAQTNVTPICAFITPSEESRKFLRQNGNIFLVYLECSLWEATKRDIKSLYSNKTPGIDYYEEPIIYDLKLNTEKLSIEECVEKLLNVYKP